MLGKRSRQIIMAAAIAISGAAFGADAASNQAVMQVQQNPTIELDISKISFVVGGSGGFGTLHIRENSYPLRVGGVTVGATVSISRADLVGQVYNLTQPSDIEGIYTAGTAGIAAAAGGAAMQLVNSKGVVLVISGRQLGLDASLDLTGMKISLN
jgi:hypothetical protein